MQKKCLGNMQKTGFIYRTAARMRTGPYRLMISLQFFFSTFFLLIFHRFFIDFHHFLTYLATPKWPRGVEMTSKGVENDVKKCRKVGQKSMRKAKLKKGRKMLKNHKKIMRTRILAWVLYITPGFTRRRKVDEKMIGKWSQNRWKSIKNDGKTTTNARN